jgi:hypothetical protein
MVSKKEDGARAHRGSETARSNRRRCVPVVAALEDRGLLSAVAVGLHAPIVAHSQRTAQIHSVTNQLARHEATVAARAFRTIHFPGGSVSIGRYGTHVVFPGGSVHASRHGAVVKFPGGYVVAGLGGTIVRFPGGSITI